MVPGEHDDAPHPVGAQCIQNLPGLRPRIVVAIAVTPAAVEFRKVDTSTLAGPLVAVVHILIRLAQDSTDTLGGRLSTVTGFAIRGDRRIDRGRVVIICCATDAQLARIRLTGPPSAAATRHPDDTWVRVEGKIGPGPTLEIGSVTPIEARPTPTRIDRRL
ncbi:hypothetical protein BH10ACT9_BH10ACT9_30660 [soil metagenome]